MSAPLEIAEEIKGLSDSISQALPSDVEALLTEGSYRASWLPRVGEMEADAQAALDRKRGEVADLFADLPATLFREKLAGETADLSRLVLLTHRLYSTLQSQLDFIRTAVSYAKQERANAGRTPQ